jgi:hypothetical protein
MQTGPMNTDGPSEYGLNTVLVKIWDDTDGDQ